MNNFLRNRLLHSFIILILIFISVTGSDCNEALENNVTPPPELLGEWKLASQTGALQDICPDEVVNFQTSNIAVLTCPGASSISRDFIFDNDILTYTQTSIEYDVEISNNNTELALYGRNVSRNLFYEKIITSVKPQSVNEKTELNNSSELKK